MAKKWNDNGNENIWQAWRNGEMIMCENGEIVAKKAMKQCRNNIEKW